MPDPIDPAAPNPQPEPEKKPKKKGQQETEEPAKISLTQEELDAKVQAAVDAHQRKQDDKAKKDREAAEKKAAEEQGKFKELAEAAEKKAAEAEAKALAAERAALIDREFYAQAKDGVTIDALNTWVRPGVLAKLTLEMTPEDVTKATKQLAEQYAKDVAGAKPKGTSGAPTRPTVTRGGGGSFIEPLSLPQNNERPARRYSTLTRRI
jgi:hypothetical protein